MKALSSFFCRASLVLLLASIPFIYTRAEEPPMATNSMRALDLSALKLSPADFTIMPQITVTSLVSVEWSRRGDEKTIRSEDSSENFMLAFELNKKEDKWELKEFDGVLTFGYLGNDTELSIPHQTVRIADRVGLYRLISKAQELGADAIIDPIISTNMARNGSKLYFKTTVTARPLTLKSK